MSAKRVSSIIAAAMALVLTACGYTVWSPPVPTTTTGYRELLEHRTLEHYWGQSMTLRADGSCTIAMGRDRPPEEWRVTRRALGNASGDGRWSVEQAGGAFFLVITKADGTPWARARVRYERREESSAFWDALVIRLDWDGFEPFDEKGSQGDPDFDTSWWRSERRLPATG